MFEDKDYPVNRGKEGEFRVGKVAALENGDIFVMVNGWKYPYRGYPMDRWVDLMAVIKGFVPALADFIKYSNKFFLIFQIKAIKKFLEQMIEVYGRTVTLNEAKPLPKRYCRSVRELHRVFTLYIDKNGGEEHAGKLGEQGKTFLWRFVELRNIICLILEWDNAYRYRFQDIMQLLDKLAFIKNPSKEILRLFDILISRENNATMIEQWVRLRKVISLFLLFAPIFCKKYLNIAKELILNLNLNELKFEIDDEYWCDIRRDYDFRGIDHEVYDNKN